MNTCKNPSCLNQTKNPKFCSRSCAATVNNQGVRRNQILGTKIRYDSCFYCTKELNDIQVKYCSTSCANAHRVKTRLDQWLAEGSVAPGTSQNDPIRLYILAEQHSKCCICLNGTMWNELPIVFVLDHIDGNSENNWRSNLRLVCPNCDSQLDTYKSKNKGKGRHARRLRYAAGISY
jgi:hypothetical protein